jgi:hypothetical protein
MEPGLNTGCIDMRHAKRRGKGTGCPVLAKVGAQG